MPYGGQYDQVLEDAGREWNVDPRLLKSVMLQESGGNPNATSSAGARGVMQFIDSTGQRMGMNDPYDPVQSIFAGAKYMSQLLDQYGSPEKALVAYSGGARGYVPAVAANYVRLARADSGPQGSSQEQPQMAQAARAKPANGNSGGDDIRTILQGVQQPAAPAVAPTTQPAPMAQPTPTAQSPAAPAPSAATAQSDDIRSIIAPSQPASATTPPATETPPSSYPPSSEFGDLGSAWWNTQATPPPGTPSVSITPQPGALGRVGQAAVQGWTGTNLLTPAAEVANQQTVVGRYFSNPLAWLAELPLKAGAAVGGAIGQGAYEAGASIDPALGRDLYILAQTAPATEMARVPIRPPAVETNPLVAAPPGPRPVEPPSIPPETAANLLTPEAKAKIAAGPPAAPTSPTEVPVTPPAPAAGAPSPQAVGAQATPFGTATMLPAETAEARTVADKKWLNQTQQPGVQDTTIHIDGITPTLVEQEQTVQAARELKTIKNLEPSISQDQKTLLDANNAKRDEFLANITGTETTRGTATRDASKQIDTELTNAWANKTPANTALTKAQIDAELQGSAGHLPPLKQAMQQVTDSLDAAGSDPQELYKTHRLINYLLSREGQKANPGYGSDDVQAALTRVKTILAGEIDNAAPGFSKAMSDYSSSIGPINAAKELQEREPGLHDTRGYLSFPKVHSLMNDIIEAQRVDAPDSPLKFVSDEQMDGLKHLHDDLKRVASAEDLARAAGSDTAQNAIDVARELAGGGVKMVAHGIANKAMPVAGSFAVNAFERGLQALSARRATSQRLQRGQEILYPPNPLTQQGPPPNPNPLTQPYGAPGGPSP